MRRRHRTVIWVTVRARGAAPISASAAANPGRLANDVVFSKSCKRRTRQNDVGLQADQLLRYRSHPIGVIAAPPKIHPNVAAIGPDWALSQPITGTADCCARATTGHTAALRSPAMNVRRFIR
jgi:hypothetical protein